MNLATYISTGYEHDCAIMVDGQGICWGENDWGQINIDDQLPVKVEENDLL